MNETEWTIRTLKEHWEAIHQKDLEALRLQAAEYERRLDNLNHEHERIAAAQHTYVSYSVLITVVSVFISVLTLVAYWFRVASLMFH